VTSLAGMGDDTRFLQMSTPIQPGNSGGPLLDMSGAVVGGVVAQLSAVNMMLAGSSVPQNVNAGVSDCRTIAIYEYTAQAKASKRKRPHHRWPNGRPWPSERSRYIEPEPKQQCAQEDQRRRYENARGIVSHLWFADFQSIQSVHKVDYLLKTSSQASSKCETRETVRFREFSLEIY